MGRVRRPVNSDTLGVPPIRAGRLLPDVLSSSWSHLYQHMTNRRHYQVRPVMMNEMTGVLGDLPVAGRGELSQILLHVVPEPGSSPSFCQNDEWFVTKIRTIRAYFSQALAKPRQLRRHGSKRSCCFQQFLLHVAHHLVARLRFAGGYGEEEPRNARWCQNAHYQSKSAHDINVCCLRNLVGMGRVNQHHAGNFVQMSTGIQLHHQASERMPYENVWRVDGSILE